MHRRYLRRSFGPRPSQQGGVFAVAVGVLLFPLLTFSALVLDIGRFYVNRTETQNAADACALAAAQQLAGPLNFNSFQRATTAGRLAAQAHVVDFQRTPLHTRNLDVAFGASRATTEWRTWDGVPGPTAAMLHVRCTVRREGINTWLLRLAGKHLFWLSAQGMARVEALTSNNCGLPTGLVGHCAVTASLVQ
jgi:Flp pilus assembly protein TadG